MSQPDLFAGVPDRVSVYEVSPRDGLQNESATVPLRGKLRLIDALVAAGLQRIEITSFVSPKWIPQLADADELAEALLSSPTHRAPRPACASARSARTHEGLERARKAGIEEIAVFMSASETHNKKNVNKTIDATLAAFEETIGPAREAGMRVRGYVSTVWGCPYEGDDRSGARDRDREEAPRHGLLPGLARRHDRRRARRGRRARS